MKKLFPDPILNNQNWAYFWIVSRTLHFVYIVCQAEDYPNKLQKLRNYETKKLSCRSLDFKRGLPHFLYDFWRKIFLFLYSFNWPNFVFWLILLHEILGNVSIANVFQPVCEVMNYKNNLIFLKKPVFLHDLKVKTKIYISWKRKELLRLNKKHFS